MKRITIPVALFVIIAAWCFGYSIAGKPAREELFRTWAGVRGANPIILKLEAEGSYLLASGENGALRKFPISQWEVDGYDLIVRFVPTDRMASSIRLEGSATKYRLDLVLESDFYVGKHEYTLESFDVVEMRFKELAEAYRNEK